VLAVGAVDDQLRDHRVVQRRDLGAGDHPGVDADAGPGRLAVAGDPARRRQEALRNVLGVDPALDRVAAQPHLVLRHGEWLAGGDPDLLADEVDPRHLLGDGVLDLDARVHLHEVVGAVGREQALDRPGRAVAAGARCLDRDRADALAQLLVDRRRGRLLDELLMPPLDRAVALAEVDDVAVRVGEDLDLHVARVLEVALDVHRRIREVRLPLAARRLERACRLGRLAHDLHPLAAAAGSGLDDQRVADLLAEPDDLLRGADRLGRPRHDRHARLAHARAGRRLVAHQLDRLRRRPDPDEAGRFDRAREPRVLGEEAVPRVHGVGVRRASGLEQLLDDEVAVRSRLAPERERVVGRRDVRRAAVGVGVDRDRPEPELAERAEHADRDLAAVRDEHLRERRHGAYSPRGWGSPIT
jgi:hypothetical protein